MNRRLQHLRVAGVCLILILMLGTFSGCKYSPKLQELIQDGNASLVHMDSLKEYDNDEDHEEETDQLSRKRNSTQSERRQDKVEEKPVAGETKRSDSPVPARTPVPSPDSSVASGSSANPDSTTPAADASGGSGNGAAAGDGDAADGTSGVGGPSSGNGGSGNGGNGSGGNGTGTKAGSGDASPGESVIPPQDVPVTPPEEPEPPNHQEEQPPITDPNGELEEPEKNPNGFAVIGDAATLFLAAGGGDQIRFTSSSIVGSPFLSEESRAGMKVLAVDTGTQAVSEASFQEMLEDPPTCCIESSRSSIFTENQIARMQEAGIHYEVWPLYSTEFLKNAARNAAALTGSAGNGNTAGLAEQYCSYLDQKKQQVAERVRAAGSSAGFSDVSRIEDGNYKGKYSLYLEGWDEGAGYSITKGRVVYEEGSGSAWAGTHSPATTLMSEMMSAAGVENTMLQEQEDRLSSVGLYIMPVRVTSQKLTVTGTAASALSFKRLLQVGLGGGLRYGLGDERYPAVIVSNAAMASGITASPLWKQYGKVYDGSLEATGYSLSDGSLIESSIDGPYRIHVSPQGLGSWDHGSAESVLEAVWIASKFYGAYTDEEVENEIRDFYHTYYHTELTGAQVGDILNGE